MTPARPSRRVRRSAMTLVELMISLLIMSLVAIVLAGLTSAVGASRDHIAGVQDASAQGRFVVDRIRGAVARSGVYRIGTGGTVAGVAVVRTADRPETLVVWTGGRDGSRADDSPYSRLPQADELLIYTPDPSDPSRLVEIVVPNAAGDVDFASSGFAARIAQLVASSSAEKVSLCDRIRLGSTGSGSAAAIRFEAEGTPTDDQLASATPGTAGWSTLPWAGGTCSSTAGLRQLAVRIEIQLLTYGRSQAGDGASLPVFGSAVRRYPYRKG